VITLLVIVVRYEKASIQPLDTSFVGNHKGITKNHIDKTEKTQKYILVIKQFATCELIIQLLVMETIF